jgi:hypothetical protein
MNEGKPWLRGVHVVATAVLGIGLVLPAVTACSSPASEETEQVEEESGESEESTDGEETDAELDSEE